MAYPSDARNHYNAINAEKKLALYKEQLEVIFEKKIKKDGFEHLGGTKTTIDVKISFEDGTTKNISLKSKKDIKSGSFDWINTTKFNKESFKKSYDTYSKYKGIDSTSKKIELENAIKEELFSISSKDLTKIFVDSVLGNHQKNEINLLLVDEKTKTVYKIKPKIFNLISNGYVLVLEKGNGKTSAKVVMVNNDDKIDLGLRVRLHLNNGWTKWRKGKNSVLCLKFQQDKVYKIIN